MIHPLSTVGAWVLRCNNEPTFRGPPAAPDASETAPNPKPVLKLQYMGLNNCQLDLEICAYKCGHKSVVLSPSLSIYMYIYIYTYIHAYVYRHVFEVQVHATIQLCQEAGPHKGLALEVQAARTGLSASGSLPSASSCGLRCWELPSSPRLEFCRFQKPGIWGSFKGAWGLI